MVLVYIMGIADILAAFMLLTGVRTEKIMYFAIFMLAYTAFFAFVRPSPGIILGAFVNIFAIVLLLNLVPFGNIAGTIVAMQLFKGFVSFWELAAVRNFAIGLFYITGKLIAALFRKAGQVNWEKTDFVFSRTLSFRSENAATFSGIIKKMI